MRMILRITFLMPLGLLSGCGGGTSSSTPGPSAPHSGRLVPMPEQIGVVEILKKAAAAGATSAEEEVTFYILKPDGSTPYSPAPTSGSLMFAEGKKVDLVVKGDALVTPPGPPRFPGADDVSGLLSVDLGGKVVSVRIGER